MKFAREIDQNIVPEWREKYLNYKLGKKKIKAVARARRTIDSATSTSSQPPPPSEPKKTPRSPFASLRDAPVYSFLQREQRPQPNGGARPEGAGEGGVESRASRTPLVNGANDRSRSDTEVESLATLGGDNAADGLHGGVPTRARAINERSPLNGGRAGGVGRGDGPGPKMTRYGSIIGSPPSDELARLRMAPSLELPQPALDEEVEAEVEDEDVFDTRTHARAQSDGAPRPPSTQLAHTGDAYKVTPPTDAVPSTPRQRYNSFTAPPRRTNSTPSQRPFARRIFSLAAPSTNTSHEGGDVALEAYREVDFRQAEFFLFLDKELLKIEKFYKSKEDEARDRLKVLREQLHIMRDRRLEEVLAAEQRRRQHTRDEANGNGNGHLAPLKPAAVDSTATARSRTRTNPLAATLTSTLHTLRSGQIGKNSQALRALGTPAKATETHPHEQYPQHTDYTRRPSPNDPPYRTAKRKLKIAMAEFYRGVELLKSYALLNRTAFRKITKKYDKTSTSTTAPNTTSTTTSTANLLTTSSSSGKTYTAEKVAPAYFVQSTAAEDLLQEAEDMYARYFERGNHKIAVGKLRAKASKPGAYYSAVARTGLLVSAGVVLGLQGVVKAFGRLRDEAGGKGWGGGNTQTNFLLQIYAGFFLCVGLMGLFCGDAGVFGGYRVNYQFIFELDSRHDLDWKQLCELPAWFTFLLGLVMWLNFDVVAGGRAMYIYWPVVLVGLSVLLLCLPPPLFYPKSRSWFLRSNFRLLLPGVYPVEFRDFFLGDMFCSLTYALGNIELFFCLYANGWRNPTQCNSSHSVLLGFLQTVPGIVRLLQCVRRYYDTRLWTHGANGGKYMCTILQYMSLSLWRIHKPNHGLEAFFIASASVNSVYCIFWDLYYDWSMPMNIYHKPPLLRNVLAYRRHIWWYYAAIALDPLLRFNWIFYVVLPQDVGQGSLCSFLIALSEVLRRGMWVLFRVENEHATNVTRYRAQRDPALPYEIMPDGQADGVRDGAPVEADEHLRETDAVAPLPTVPGVSRATARAQDEEQGRLQPPSASVMTAASSLRQRRAGSVVVDSPVFSALKRAGTTMLNAHAQDYERKRVRKEDEKAVGDGEDEDEEDSDEEDDD
ncbi:hypothetical protein LTR08_007347 [Meristemomyces frigidus]|nr:hypothetical protein LTR08_007347 [Meristemomyces frigidus]